MPGGFIGVDVFFVISGFGYKYIAPINAFLGLIVVNFSHSFGISIHVHMPVILASFPLAFSPAYLTYSIDSIFLREKWTINREQSGQRALFNMRLVLCLVYFSAGISKLRNGGVSWITGDTLRTNFIAAPINYPDVNSFARILSINTLLYDFPTLCRLLALLVVSIELAAPLALLGGAFSVIIISILLLLQVGAYFTIFVNFSGYLSLFAAWIPVFIIYIRQRIDFNKKK